MKRSSVPPTQSTLSPLSGITVLVIDDQEDARTMVARFLQIKGATVEKAGSVAEAMQRLQTLSSTRHRQRHHDA